MDSPSLEELLDSDELDLDALDEIERRRWAALTNVTRAHELLRQNRVDRAQVYALLAVADSIRDRG